jgi:pilus assembly protein CpaC
MRKAWLLLLITTLILFPGRGFVFSQEAKSAALSSTEETLYKGEMKSIGVNVPSRVVIGQPEVADILTVSTKEIVVVGKGAGSTNLIWWDNKGEHLTQLRVLAEDMGYINTRINNLIKELNLPDVTTQPSDSEGKVLLLGRVKTKEDVDRIRTALGGLFAKTTNLIQVEEEKAIIELEVEILEVDKGSTKNVGMDWLASGGSVDLAEPSKFVGNIADIPESLFRINEWTRGAMLAKLNLLISEGKARILSRPKLACQSGKEAQLVVGAEQPTMTTQVTSTTGSSATSIEYKEYGIKLKMSPVLDIDGRIKLKLNVEVSDIGKTAETLGGGTSGITAKAYPFTKRATSTEVYLKNDQTLAISGLIKQKTTEELKKFPWLGDVPILGVFFRSRSSEQGGGSLGKTDTELVILVTPSVVEENKVSKQELEKRKNVKAELEETAVSGPGFAQEKKSSVTGAVLPASNTNNKGVLVSRESTFGGEKESGKKNNQIASKQPRQAGQTSQGGSTSSDNPVFPSNPTERYIQQVTEYLGNNISYPWTAKQAKIEGAVVLNLHLAKSGDLLESNVGSSSGYSVLDENAMRIARQIIPYPPFPKEVSEQDLWLQIPVEYKIKQKR